jgi:hypothetical protein
MMRENFIRCPGVTIQQEKMYARALVLGVQLRLVLGWFMLELSWFNA